MKQIGIVILIIIVLSGQIMAYKPPLGIPDPADSMGFDPLNIERPNPLAKCPGWPGVSSKANGNPCDCYYIDNDDANATDASNQFGSPEKPRVTIPSNVNIAPNSYIEIHGGNNYPQTFRPLCEGKLDSLIWFVGKEKPILAGYIDLGFYSTYDSLRYIIFDSLTVHNNHGADIRPRYDGHHFSNIVFRGCEFFGYKNIADGSAISIGSSSPNLIASLKNVVLYNCKVHDFGNDIDPGEECLVYTTSNTSNIWVLKNELFGAAEDGIAGGHLSNHTIHGYYIGDNYIHNNVVNGIDLKQVYDVIISHNIITDHFRGNNSGPAIAIVLHYSGTSTPPGVWTHFPYYANVVNNIIDGSRQGIVTSSVFNINIFGNIIKNISHDSAMTYNPSSAYSTGTAMSIRGIRGNCIIEKNSISKVDGGIKIADAINTYSPAATYYNSSYVQFNNLKYVCINDNNDAGIIGVNPTNTIYWKPCTLAIINNLSMAGNEPLDCDLQFQSATYGTLFKIDRNDFFLSGDTSKIRWGGGFYDLHGFQVATGKCTNCIEANPSTVSDTNLRLKTGSILIGSGESGFSSQSHYNLYKLYLNRDYDSLNIPTGSSYDIGAFQYNACAQPCVTSVKLDALNLWAVVKISGTNLENAELFLDSDSLGPVLKDTVTGMDTRFYWFRMVPSD